MDIKQGIKILGTGSYLPPLTVKNEDFTEFIDTSDEWIASRTGMSERHFCAGQTNFFMAGEAAKKALASAGIPPEEIDLIIVSTCTPDFFYPSVSCFVQNITGAKNAAAVDVSAACAGFVNALDIARSYLAIRKYKKILVVSSEVLSRQTDFTDRSTCILFGDGAGAVVVEGSHKPYASLLGAIGESYPNIALYCKVNYESNMPFGKSESQSDDFSALFPPEDRYISMDGKGVYKFAVDIMPKIVKESCAEAGFALSDLDLLIPHQANIRIIKAAMKEIDVPMERVFVNIDKTGNISSACIPAAFDELAETGKLKSGMKICLAAFGAGLTYGAVAFET